MNRKVLRQEIKKKWGGHRSKTLTERGDDCFDLCSAFLFGEHIGARFL